jgi:hypothetical protein
MSLHKLMDNVFFDLLDLLYTRMCQRRVDFEPSFNIFHVAIGLRAAGIGSNKDDFEFTSMKVVANDDLVTVSLEGGTSFGYQKLRVCFELKREESLEV